ncbi:MAG: methytransferase partner Trm112 [Thermoplasmatales archaeon]|nr:methytransferase partner Trm112 [Thermoplasmatales archaeon]
MKKELMDILCCPVCKSDLELRVEKEEKDEIIEGKLVCRKCGEYKIEDGIPNLLPKEQEMKSGKEKL